MADDAVATWEQYKQDHPPGSPVTGVVKHVAPYGAYVDLGVPFAALLLVPYMAPIGARKSYPQDYPKVGDPIAAFVRIYGDPFSANGSIGLTQDANAVE